MKVILLKDIPKIGKKFEVKDVAEGHVSNFLLPKGLVSLATSQAIEKINQMKNKESSERKMQEDLLAKNLEVLKSSEIKIKSKANEKGHLFAGINKENLIKEILKQLHLNLNEDSVVIEKPIKEIGEHKIKIQAMGKHAELRVLVENI